MTIDSSRAEISRFRSAAAAGTVKFDPDAARRCAALYEEQADKLAALRQRLETASEAGGFGGFVSAQQLQAGFAHKARDAADLLDRYIEAAYRMKEAFLLSAGLLDEADAAAAAALRAVDPRQRR
ncbi:hypothetical protein [Nocardia asteroides]|uniref:Uncharacterized protein n=1 Tax=Nocardia asteroides NBRC 15531 TaxID=1110697 RepID=U5EQ52_NOCAS|nr:hypothetical protein [Nocardia asteroides]TLF63460.1 hypothetical protein FEK33_25945 [Nocardia asteroides NBRC 15531]UGT47097.1 hypothetical protein LT345_21570 [Nocardia asteroides]SFM79652.1 hypothetical protein SAMN05444423_104261 [Nocardia asteroides]VEG34026.1 Uncharacterised protein [Nocardia asteroides]GAD87184.1 hypothetical protein NCAST_34_03140 [Nocardia asteroides NBRC 15531]